MLTGRRAFRGADTTDTLALVLGEEPDWTALPEGLSPRIRAKLEQCLAKDREKRVQSIGDVRLAIDGARNWVSVGVTSAAVVFGALVVVTVVGFVASQTLDGGLNRAGVFGSDESLFDWTWWGMRSLVAPVVGIVLPSLVAFVLLGFIARMALAIPPVRRLSLPVRAWAARAVAVVAAQPTRAIGEVLLVVQLAALVLFLRYFWDIFSGFVNFTLPGMPGELSELSPSHPLHTPYRLLSSFQLLVFGFAWFTILRRQVPGKSRAGRGAVVGGVALLALPLAVFAMSYRVLSHGELERVLLPGSAVTRPLKRPARSCSSVPSVLRRGGASSSTQATRCWSGQESSRTYSRFSTKSIHKRGGIMRRIGLLVLGGRDRGGRASAGGGAGLVGVAGGVQWRWTVWPWLSGRSAIGLLLRWRQQGRL